VIVRAMIKKPLAQIAVRLIKNQSRALVLTARVSNLFIPLDFELNLGAFCKPVLSSYFCLLGLYQDETTH